MTEADPIEGPSPEETAEELDKAEAEKLLQESWVKLASAGALMQDVCRENITRSRFRLDLATKLVCAWTVGKPEAADEISVGLAAMVVTQLEEEFRKIAEKELTP